MTSDKLNFMKTFKIFSVLLFTLAIAGSSYAQKAKTETIPVSGNCGMCKSKIEKAAKTAGASEASWSADTKSLTIKYNSTSTNAAKIQQAVAAVGYDTRDVRATDESYDKLHSCCKYERAGAAAEKAHACCGDKCEMKDGKCTDMTACKDKGCCDANGVCKAGSECKHAKGADGKASCCQSH